MGEADRDWNPLENMQPSPIWTSLPGAKLSSTEKVTDVNSSSLLLDGLISTLETGDPQ